MKRKQISIFLISALLFCSCTNAPYYSIKVENVGTRTVWVNDIHINKKETIGVGILSPEISKTTLSVASRPNERFPMTWKDYKTGEYKSLEVEVELPTKFWKGMIHREVIISLNPDTATTEISYAAYEPNEDKDYHLKHGDLEKP